MKVTIVYPLRGAMGVLYDRQRGVGRGPAWSTAASGEFEVELPMPPKAGDLLELPNTHESDVYKVDHVLWQFRDEKPSARVGVWWDGLEIGDWPYRDDSEERTEIR